ncbi:DUF2505 family protein [Sandaracinus amylolyticus]|uniref:DUF2505 domain-containing protein n=1 Tax=Sandaracinus amylolyticus TaxID=927083 RepID=A0A0F6YN17_9BACT|nr:DUF2505 family protein [Sandaracinus amylolyticus]AKF09895.1 hypothetical protein DB32_007044 [Sandaracinus amylolyticus]
MQIRIRHRFEGATREQVEALYLVDDDFNREAFERIQYERSVVELRRDGDHLKRVLRVRARGAVPAPLQALVPAGGFHFDEHTEYDFARHRGTWKTVPGVLHERVRASGTFEIVDVEGGAEIRFDGETKASLPLIGRAAERFALSTAEASHAALAAAARERLAKTS